MFLQNRINSGKNGGGYLGGGSGIFLFSAASPDPGGTFEAGGNVTGGRRGAGLSYYGMTSGGVTMAVIPESLIVGGTLSGGADGPAICGMVSDMDAVMEEMAAIAGNESLSDEEKDAAMAELMEGVLRQAHVRNLTEKEQKDMLDFLRQNGMRDNIADIRWGVFIPASEEEKDGAELRTVTDSATGVSFTGLLLPGERLQVTLLGPDSPEYQQLLAKLQPGESLGPVYLVSIAGGSPRSVSGSLTLPGQGTFLSLSGGRLDSVQNGAGRTASVTLSGVFALAS